MKKLMFVAVALAAGIAVADVTSANIVGYVNSAKQIAAGKVSLGTSPFAKVGTDTVAIQDMLKSSAPAVGYAKRNTDAVQLQVWNGSNYTLYFYLSDAYIEETDDEVEGWAKGNGDMVKGPIVDPSYGMWAKSPSADGKITFVNPIQK